KLRSMTGGSGETSAPAQAAAQAWRKCVELAPSQAAWCMVTPRARPAGAGSRTVACTARTAPPSGSAGTSGTILETSLSTSVASSSMLTPSCSATVKATPSPGW
uniref:Uncharacterized protein n=1 Tax=Oryza brachyantha TaxID=4533 RepID=J3LCX0_ORYBR